MLVKISPHTHAQHVWWDSESQELYIKLLNVKIFTRNFTLNARSNPTVTACLTLGRASRTLWTVPTKKNTHAHTKNKLRSHNKGSNFSSMWLSFTPGMTCTCITKLSRPAFCLDLWWPLRLCGDENVTSMTQLGKIAVSELWQTFWE